MTNFEKEELKWELESYANITLNTYKRSNEKLLTFKAAGLKDFSAEGIKENEREFQDLLHKMSRDRSNLRGFCKAMEIVEENLKLGLEIPEEGKII